MIKKELIARLNNLKRNLNLKDKNEVLDFLMWVLSKNGFDKQYDLKDEYRGRYEGSRNG
jgi:hypothetical protein